MFRLTDLNPNFYSTVTREELRAVPVPPAGDRPIWKGTQHGEYVDALVDGFEATGLKVAEESYMLGKGGTFMQGCVTFDQRGSLPVLPEGIKYSCGFLHGNMSDFAHRLVVGAKIYICSNGMAIGELSVREKHTYAFNLNRLVERAVDAYRNYAIRMARRIADMQTSWCGSSDRLLCELARTGVVSWSDLSKLDKLYDTNPRTTALPEKFRQWHDGTQWGRYNTLTYFAQSKGPRQQHNILVDGMDVVRRAA